MVSEFIEQKIHDAIDSAIYSEFADMLNGHPAKYTILTEASTTAYLNVMEVLDEFLPE